MERKKKGEEGGETFMRTFSLLSLLSVLGGGATGFSEWGQEERRGKLEGVWA